MSTSKETYQVIARKWRPRRFDELVGQQHVSRTLKNTIMQNRVGHAYLFVGPRGTGKTTSARIFAKALNCESGIVEEPCCECKSCLEIAASSSLDVIEIDGASHNKVDDIRDIRDNVIYTPSRSRYKIYIIDEVHMLTNAAWNALLKTLEEPPPHVKFLFATTEPHKVIRTVLSRCQRFDLKPIPAPLIAERLRMIADAEKVNIDDRALSAVARAADGGMRDGQSIFDQIISFCGSSDPGTPIGEQDVLDVFGLASGTELKNLTGAIFANDIPGVISVIQKLADSGRDLERLYSDLVYYVRNLMIATSCPNPADILEVNDDEMKDLSEIASSGVAHLVPRILNGLVNSEQSFRYALNKRVSLEVAVVRTMRDTHSLQIDDLIAQLNSLRDGGVNIPVNTTSQPVVQQLAPQAASPMHTPPVDQKKTAELVVEQPKPKPEQVPAPQKPEPIPQAPAPQVPVQQIKEEPPAPEPPPSKPEPLAEAPKQTEPPPTPVPAPQPVQAPAESKPVQPPPPPQQEYPQYDPGLEIQEEEPEDMRDTTVNPGDEEQLWQKIKAEVEAGAANDQLKNCLQYLNAASWIHETLDLNYRPEEMPAIDLEYFMSGEPASELTEILKRITGSSIARVILKKWLQGVSSNETDLHRQTVDPEARERIAAHPFVQNVCEAFNGRLIDVRTKN